MLSKLFTFRIKGVKYVPTVKMGEYLIELIYSDTMKYQVIIDSARTDFGWKIIRDSIKEDIKRHEKNM